MVDRWSISGLRKEVHLKYGAVDISSGLPLDEIEAERLVLHASKHGKDVLPSMLRRRYQMDLPQAQESMDVWVFPEIVAALYELIKRPQTPEGIHGFLDIGAGTLDACVFRIKRNRENVQAIVLNRHGPA